MRDLIGCRIDLAEKYLKEEGIPFEVKVSEDRKMHIHDEIIVMRQNFVDGVCQLVVGKFLFNVKE